MELFLVGLFIAGAFIHLALIKEHIIPYILVYNVLFDVLGYTFDHSSSKIAMARAVFLYASAALFYIKYGIRLSKTNMCIAWFLVYTLFLCFFSYDAKESLRVYLRVAFYLIYFDVVYRYFTEADSRYERYFKSFIWILVSYSVYTLLANIFKLGTIYANLKGVSDGFQTGSIIGDFLLQFSFAIVLIPVIFYYVKDKKFKLAYILLSAMSIALLLISARRTSVIIIIVAYLIFIFFYHRKAAVTAYALGFAVVASIFIGIFKDEIIARYKARADRLEVESFEAEGRTLEYGVVSNIIFSFKDPVRSLMGQDIYIGHGLINNFSNARRLHTDYAKVLHGSGILGLIMYAALLIAILIKAVTQRVIRIKGDKYGLHAATVLMLIISKLILTYNGGLHVISYNSIIFGTAGLIFAIQKRQMVENKKVAI